MEVGRVGEADDQLAEAGLFESRRSRRKAELRAWGRRILDEPMDNP